MTTIDLTPLIGEKQVTVRPLAAELVPLAEMLERRMETSNTVTARLVLRLAGERTETKGVK